MSDERLDVDRLDADLVTLRYESGSLALRINLAALTSIGEGICTVGDTIETFRQLMTMFRRGRGR